MESMRSTWTDSRLDDFAGHTARRFDDLERRMDRGFDRVDEDLHAVSLRIDGLQRTMSHGVIAITAAILAGFGGMAGLIATQL